MGSVSFQGAGIAHNAKSGIDDLEPCDGKYSMCSILPKPYIDLLGRSESIDDKDLSMMADL